MRIQSFLPVAASLLLFLTACGGNDAGNKADGSTAGTNASLESGSANQITFKVDGAEVRTEGHHLSRSRMGGKEIINITSSMHVDPRTVNINLAGITPGTYPLSATGSGVNGQSGGLYFPKYENYESFTFTDGSVVISKLDTVANIMEGTFSGTARSADGKMVRITDGVIRGGALVPGIEDVDAAMK